MRTVVGISYPKSPKIWSQTRISRQLGSCDFFQSCK